MRKARTNNGFVGKLKVCANFNKLTKQLKSCRWRRSRSSNSVKCDLICKESRLELLTFTDSDLSFGSTRGTRYLRRGTQEDFLHNGSFFQAVGSVLAMAQCFCLMPVCGIKSKNVRCLSFSWRYFRTWYCMLYIVTTAISTGFTSYMLVQENTFDVRNIEPLIFHISSLLGSVGFLILAAKWPKLMLHWAQVEQQLPPHTSWLEREELALRIKKLTLVLTMISLMEHLLSTISAIHFANYCPARADPIESYFASVVSHLFYVFEYANWLGWLGKIQNVLMTFGWSYMDVFCMIMAIGLSSLFKQVQRSILMAQGKIMPESFWTRTRLQYRLVCDLIEEVDEVINGLIMISFANDLYFVCIQLLKSINKMPSVAHGVYFYFSLSFLLARTLALSLFLAEVNDRSLEPVLPLRLVPKAGYYTEVERFAYEVASDHTALTGLRFFSVTRKLVMTVAGTIITYELVLIQFHEDQNLWNCGE